MHAQHFPEKGSSPRPRGAPDFNEEAGTLAGLIPASAGSTRRRRWARRGSWAHPRVRGEHQMRSPRRRGHSGSSPRPRGALTEMQCGASISGLIPASAGSTQELLLPQHPVRAHPRVRGEHVKQELAELIRQGSSPRPRGAQVRREPRCRAAGLIPASAGSTSYRMSKFSLFRAHPRVRGEHFAAAACWLILSGSSPRPRGARIHNLADIQKGGLIPASAGSTSRRNTATNR